MSLPIAIASDEISHDFETAVTIGLKWGIERFELKRLNERRIPDVDDADLKMVEDTLSTTGAQLTSLAPGLFKGPLEPRQLRDELDRLKRTLRLAERFDVHRIVVFGFARDETLDDTLALAQVIDALGQAADIAARAGAVLLLENEPAFWADCPDAALAVMKGINSNAMRVNWDPCNSLGCACGAPYPYGYELLKPYIAHLHVKDARLVADSNVEYVVLGTGDLDWVGQFAALIRDGYGGYCVLEPHFGDRIQSSHAAVTAVRELMHKAVRIARQ